MVGVDGNDVIVLFGAGATKACGGPLTAEILPEALARRATLERDGQLALVDEFLREHFHVPSMPAGEDYPDLPLVLSLIDTARARDEAFGSNWDRRKLDELRGGLEYAAFALLEDQLRSVPYANPYRILLEHLCQCAGRSLTVISLNYDIIVDNVLAGVMEPAVDSALPDYACDIATPGYRAATELPRSSDQPLRLRLLKLHGSLNWMYCANCQRLDLGVAASGRGTVKVLDELWSTDERLRLEEGYTPQGRKCMDCGARVRALLITPTAQKDYRNPHIARIWYSAARALRQTDRVIVVGYSLPHDDVEVAYLLKRGLGHLDSDRITVVEHGDPQMPLTHHEIGRRYRSLFGDGLDWHPEGFAAWVDKIRTRR